MAIKSLCTNVWPLVRKKNRKEIKMCFIDELSKADEIRISTAYFSKGSLEALDELVDLWKIKKVCLILGMYNKKNFPKESYELALDTNKKWQKASIGEIRLAKRWRNHEKLYCFLRNGQIFSAIAGSANLSFLHDRKYPQYEQAVLIEDFEALKDFLEHINDLLASSVTVNINKFFLTKISAYTKFLKSIPQ